MEKGLTRKLQSTSLFWRVFALNALVFIVGTAVLALTPATVSFPLAATEAIVLGAGLTAMLVANAFLLRLGFAPLEHLTRLMERIDLLQAGQRLAASGSSEVVKVIETFNDMLDRLESERRSSSGRALRAQEEERHRVARELHDEIGQDLTVVLLQLKRASELAPPEARSVLLDAQETARGSLDDVRRIARQLRPETLDELGLVSALVVLATSFSALTGLPVERKFDSDLPTLPEEVEVAIYRIAQESLTNVARHAGASRVELAVTRTPGGLRLRVADDGRGLKAARTDGGIRGMQERAILIGAELALAPGPGGGLEVRLEVPIDAS